jgi:hypothetical protein
MLDKAIRNIEISPHGIILERESQYLAYADVVVMLGRMLTATKLQLQSEALKADWNGMGANPSTRGL